jgi:Mrp family chromosome partitioning ATPase
MDDVSPFEPTVVGAAARYWRFILVVVLAVTIPATLYAVTRPKTSSATASLTVADPSDPGVAGGQTPADPARYVSDQLAVFKSASLGERAALRGHVQHPPLSQPASWYLAGVSAGASAADSNILSVSFSAPSSGEALAGLRAVVGGYSDVVKASNAAQAKTLLNQVNASIASLDAQLAVLNNAQPSAATTAQIQQLNVSRSALIARQATVSSEAAVPSSGISQVLYPNDASTTGLMSSLRLIVAAIMFGLLLGVGLGYVRAYRHRIFRHARDPELVLGAPLLIDASILRTNELIGAASERESARVEPIAKEMFSIATSLVMDQRHQADRRGMSLAVVSALKGKSSAAVAWRSAFAFASQGLRVVLIDVYGSRPPASEWWNQVADHLSWQERADGRLTLGGALPARTSGWLLAGPPGTRPTVFTRPAQLGLYYCGEAPPVRSQRDLTDVLLDLENNFDVVLVVAPPFLASADAAHLTTAAGAIMAVVPDGGSVTDHEEFTRRLRISGSALVGYVYCAAETGGNGSAPPNRSDRAALPAKTTRARAS